ncbi:uncharacterized protein JCM15063_003214 [Sporobolomyces koalae]|uniref:uncharacterized protein n=1 Tax=Sporobolomyces koalae TaxID=500713 RepID=UPI00317F8DDA
MSDRNRQRRSSRRKDPTRPAAPSRPGSQISHRSITHQDIAHTVTDAFEEIERFGRDGAQIATQVEKFGKTGKHVVEVVEKDFFGNDQEVQNKDTEKEEISMRGRNGVAGQESSQEEDEPANASCFCQNRPLLKHRPVSASSSRVIPYQPSNIASTAHKSQSAPPRDEITALRSDLDSTQERIDDMFDLLETIAGERERLTGIRSQSQNAGRTSAESVELGSTREHKIMIKMKKRLSQAKTEIIAVYQQVCLHDVTYNKIRQDLPTMTNESRKLMRDHGTLNSSFAKILDFVEDRAKEETQAAKEGISESRLLQRIEGDHPEWDRTKTLAEVKRVKTNVRQTKGPSSDNVETYVEKWIVENPFTELDRTALQEIDVRENQVRQTSTALPLVSAPADHSTNKGFEPLPSQHLPSASHRQGRSNVKHGKPKSKSKTRSTTKSYELSHDRKSHKYAELSDASTDTDELQDLEAQRRGTVHKAQTQQEKELANTEIPYSVPSDDTSGYVESRAELLQDQKDRIATEHFWTPFVIVEWILIVIMLFYWIVTRGIGYQNPLGNINWARVVGDDAWSDTKPTSSATLALHNSTTSSQEATSILATFTTSQASTIPAQFRTTSYSALIGFGTDRASPTRTASLATATMTNPNPGDFGLA